MKRFFFSILLLIAARMDALPLGNPVDPHLYEGHCIAKFNFCFCPSDCIFFKGGYYGDFVFNRHMSRKEGQGSIEHTRLTTNAGLLAINFFQCLDVYGTIGATSAMIETAALFSPTRITLEYDTAFSWSIGAKAILYQAEHTYMGVEFQYFTASLPIKRSTLGGITSEYGDLQAQFREWQFGAALGYRFPLFVPYIGLKWSHFTIQNGDSGPFGIIFPDFKTKKSPGWGIGVTLIAYPQVGITVEGRWGDEKGCHVNGQISF